MPKPSRTEEPTPAPEEPTEAGSSSPHPESTFEETDSPGETEPASPKPATPSTAPDLRLDYAAKLAAWIERHKRYPQAAQRRRQEGDVLLRIRIDRGGNVLSFRAEAMSGHRILDDAALAMVRRADPFPPFPEGLSGAEMEFLLPVIFQMQ